MVIFAIKQVNRLKCLGHLHPKKMRLKNPKGALHEYPGWNRLKGSPWLKCLQDVDKDLKTNRVSKDDNVGKI